MNTLTTYYNRHKNWNSFQEVQSEIDRLVKGGWNSPGDKELSSRTWQPACDVIEDQEHYLLRLEMAGVPKDQIQIEIIDQQLVINGERTYEDKKRENGILYSERLYGKFERKFDLPAGLDLEKIEASHQNGVLRIIVPKSEITKPRKIKIEGSSFLEN